MAAKYSIGIGLNILDARAILLRDDKKVIAQIDKKRGKVTANETIEVLLHLYEGILEETAKFKNDIAGVGIALGGIVNKGKGIVYWPHKQHASYTYIALPLKDYLEKKFGFPVILENDANASVVAEKILNFPEHKNVIYMFSGVGAGIIIDGKLYRGKDGCAGELFLNIKDVKSSYLGDFSFLKQWNVDLGIVERAKECLCGGKRTSLIKKISPTGILELRDIFNESKKDKVSKDILKEAALSLGAKIAFVVNLLNPELVIVGGGLEEAPDFFIQECLAATKSFSFSETVRNFKMVYSSLGKTATSMGAAMIALRPDIAG